MGRMKLIMFIFLNIIAGEKILSFTNNIFKYISIQEKTNFYFPVKDYFPQDYIPLYTDEDQSYGLEKNLYLNSLKQELSTELVFSFGRFFHSTRLPKTQIGQLNKVLEEGQNIISSSWGGQIELAKKDSPLSLNFMAGKVNYSASISRLKDNSFSSSNALRQKSKLNTGLEAYLTNSLSAKENSFYSQFNYSFNKKKYLSLQTAYTENKNTFVSLIFKEQKRDFSLTAALFTLEGTSSQWKSKSPLFPKKNLLSLEAFYSDSFNFLYTSQSLIFTGQPLYKHTGFCINSQNCFFLKDWILWLNINFSTPNLFTLDSKYDTTPFQIQFNPQKKWTLKKNKFLYGGILYQLNLNEPLYFEEKYYIDQIICTQLKLTTEQNTLSFKIKINSGQDTSYLNTSLYFKTKIWAACPSAIFSVSISEESWSFYSKINGCIKNTIVNEISFSKNSKWQEESNSTLSFGSNISFVKKKFKFTGKILFTFSL